ncbi:hypothetical protein BDR05DRAFT_947216 [Suillus weaverae]|nr:hypothetical protein BDR05DRAFT_947216 [Suillus weaverae]
MSSESTPVLSCAVAALKHLMEQWEKTAQIATHYAPMIKIGLTWADKYNHKMSKTNAYAVVMYVNPILHLSWIDGHWGEEQAHAAKDSQQPHTTATLGAQIYGIPHLDLLLHHPGVQTVEEEFNTYSTSHLCPDRTDTLAFWKASAVPCKHIFSLSSEMCMKKQNHLSSTLMEMLQMLKFLLKKE